MSKEYTIFNIANWFLSKKAMTHKKLQKLCYYAQAWSLALHGKKLFSQNFQAWIHGPVCCELYHEYKAYYWKKIPKYKDDISFDKDSLIILDSVFESYDIYDEFQLESLTLSEEPWIKAREDKKENEPSNNIISDESMTLYYQSEFNKDQND